MHRHIVYPGSIPLDTDVLSAIKDSYYGVGWLSESVIGVNTQVVGLAVTPTTPASLQVNVAPGAIYSLQTVDSAAYGSLGIDANQFIKQGILAASATLTITPPGTVGQSINYLVQVAFAETDANPVILPYYNASNPSVAWSGPNNTGVAQNTVRTNTCVVGLKAGAPAATGSQVTPAPDVGYTGIYVVTVAQGQTTITGGNIALLGTAPYFPSLPQVPTGVQSGQWLYGVAGGSANTITTTLTPAPPALVVGLEIAVQISTTNTGTATLNLNGLGAKPIVRPNGEPLLPNDLYVGGIRKFIYDGTSFRVNSPGYTPQSATVVFTTNGSFTVPAGVTKLTRVRVWAGGGGGGGANSSNSVATGSGGGGGGYAEGSFTVTPGQVLTITVGTSGLGGTTTGNGGAGGTSSVGALISATGGIGGFPGNNGIANNSGSGGSGFGGAANFTGGGGGFGIVVGSSAMGGFGGSAPFGGASPTPNIGSGQQGIFPGGGGNGGSVPVGQSLLGGGGATGLIIIEY